MKQENTGNKTYRRQIPLTANYVHRLNIKTLNTYKKY